MKKASLRTTAGLATAGIIALTSAANAQSPAQENPETLNESYLDVAMAEAQSTCELALPTDSNIRLCIEKAFEAETKLFIHWRNVTTQYLYDLPFPQRIIGDGRIGFAISQVDLACRFPAQAVADASKKDTLTLANAFNNYQQTCSSALGEQTKSLSDYGLPFKSTPRDYGIIDSFTGGALRAIVN